MKLFQVLVGTVVQVQLYKEIVTLYTNAFPKLLSAINAPRLKYCLTRSGKMWNKMNKNFVRFVFVEVIHCQFLYLHLKKTFCKLILYVSFQTCRNKKKWIRLVRYVLLVFVFSICPCIFQTRQNRIIYCPIGSLICIFTIDDIRLRNQYLQ